MDLLVHGNQWAEATCGAIALALTAGAVLTAFRMDRSEWRKWRRWRLLAPQAAWWPFWMLVVVIILVPSVQGRTGIAWPLVAIVGLADHGLLLDRSIQEHLGREQRRRHAEMAHWQTRVRAERWLAQQSLMKRCELARVQVDSLRHLMDPHFLFNALNGVMHDFLRGERKAGLANLQAFRRLAVDQIQAGRGGWLTLDREWSMLGDYIQLELRRMDRPVDWTLLPIPEGMRTKQIPAFMIQPLVENALWHGLGGTAVHGAGSLSLEVRPGPADRAIVLVRNSRHDGQNEGEDHPINHHASPRRRRHATDLIRQRLALMEHRDPDALRLDTTPSEAQARLVLPCRGTLWTTS